MHPQIKQVPPSALCFSTTATFKPSCAALMAATYPPVPAPITTTSNSVGKRLPRTRYQCMSNEQWAASAINQLMYDSLLIARCSLLIPCSRLLSMYLLPHGLNRLQGERILRIDRQCLLETLNGSTILIF